MPSPSVLQCGQALIEKGKTIAFAESATGGRLCAEFVLAPDAGQFLKSSLVTYDVGVKQALLGVPGSAIERFTPESAEVTRLMTLGLQRQVEADLYISITGLTHPGGSEHPGKPVGTMFIHMMHGTVEVSVEEVFSGDPETIILLTVDEVAHQIIKLLDDGK